MSASVYLEHAEAGSLDISGAVHIALHEVHAIFGQTCQQDALQVARLLHLIGQFVDVSRQLESNTHRNSVYQLRGKRNIIQL